MKKNYFALLFAIMGVAGKSNAQTVQPCGTDEVYKEFKQQYPEILIKEKAINEEIAAYLKSQVAAKRLGRTTDDADTVWIDIPLAVHVMHNGGNEVLADNKIFALVAEMNRFYSLHSDTVSVIKPFKKYVGKAYIRFHLATKDPLGNTTKGITHHYTYLTYGSDEQAKMDQWPNSSYVNIWFENVIGRGTGIPGVIVAAYATPPSTAAVAPYSDGIISSYLFVNDGGTQGGTVDHEMGHILNLAHTFGQNGGVGDNHSGACTDDDGVDDTPPTSGHQGGCSLWDTVCAQNYFQIYTDMSGHDSLVNYPDTANEQNVMNYADCKVMFTKGQVARMRAALRSSAGGRNNLWQPANLFITGVTNSDGSFAATPDMSPVADFVVGLDTAFGASTDRTNYMRRAHRFTFPNTKIRFTNISWNDTITSVDWSFSQGAITTTSTNIVSNSFPDGGWVSVSLTAHGNNTADGTITVPHAAFVADPTAAHAQDVVMEFDNADTTKWPTFNYYNNEFKWQLANVGYYDHNSIQYTGFDDRVVPLMGIYPNTGTPKGDFDDLFSVPLDLTGFTGNCNLNFYYSGASRSSMSNSINDALEIDYSKDGVTWTNLTKINKNKLTNKGALAIPYYPINMSDWAPMSVSIPPAARSAYTVIRFRYKPGVAVGYDGTTNTGTVSSGNNFFMDRITFSEIPVSVDNAQLANIDVAVVPNPTGGDAYVVVKDAANTTAHVVVTDITGKVVYTTSEQVTGSKTHILIPHSAIAVPGMYMVQTATGNQARTQKLVVY